MKVYARNDLLGEKSDCSDELDPHKTIAVLRHKGRKVGRIPATARNATRYIDEMVRQYGELQIDYVPDTTGGVLAMLHTRRT